MDRFWRPVIGPLLDAAGAATVVEIGVYRGATTRMLVERAKRIGGVVHAIDTAPEIDVDEWQAEHAPHLCFHRGRSHDMLPRVGAVDAALVDGDHNWFTVNRELELLALATGDAPPPLVIAHDVGWPYGRRDMYYDPAAIPSGRRHEIAPLEGMLPGERETVPGGYNHFMSNARFEGGPHNGVLTAIEDFVAGSDEAWDLLVVDGFHGLGVLVPRRRLEASPALRAAIARIRSADFAIEWARLLEGARIQAEVTLWRGNAGTLPPSDAEARASNAAEGPTGASSSTP